MQGEIHGENKICQLFYIKVNFTTTLCNVYRLETWQIHMLKLLLLDIR